MISRQAAASIHILGAGSIGMFLAASLRLANYHPRLLLRGDTAPKLRTICLQQQGARPRLIDIPCQSVQSKIPLIETVLVSTKAFDAVEAIESIKHKIQMDATIVILSNGALAIQEALRDIQTVSLGTITHGVYRDDNDGDTNDMCSIVHAGVGDIRLEGHLSSLASTLDQSGLNCQIESTIRTTLWKKLAANCVINPLTSFYGCLNGELETRVDGFVSKVLPEIVKEVYIVFCSDEHQVYSTQQLEEWERYVMTVVQNTAFNQSSMLQDVKKKRRTEIDFLNGFVVRKANGLGLPCTRNEELLNMIKIVDFSGP